MPPAWSYNPSTWRERLPIVVAAVVAAGIAFYLAAYQLRIVDSAWDPFLR